jgi:hypothetical protein
VKRLAAILFLIISAFLMLRITLPYFSFKYDIGFLLTKQSILHSKLWRLAFYTHISSSLFVLITGGIQFARTNASPKFHRIAGTIYALTILLISAPSGLVMSVYANGGVAAKFSFALISILWWLFTYQAYTTAKNKKWDSHRAFMLRSFALTLSAITLRTYALALPAFIHLAAKDAYTLVSYMSWIPNLLIAEYIIRRTKLFNTVVSSFNK